MPAELNGRKGSVTGCASGIGAACAAAFAAAGAAVTVADLDERGARKVAEPLAGTAVGVDLADPALDAAALAGGMDVIVNNAGIQHVAPVEDFPEEKFHLIIALMLEAPFRLVRAALPHMYAEGWGRIVNISSVHGLRASPFKSACVAAKHGLEGLSKTIALRGRPPRRHLQHDLPRLRPHPPGGKAGRRPGPRPWHPGIRGDREDHAHRARGQAPRRARGGSGPGRPAVRAVDVLCQRWLLPARRRLDGPINSKSFFRTTSGDFVAGTVSKMLG